MSMPIIYVLVSVVAVALLVSIQFALAPMLAVRRRVKKVRILGGIGEYIVWDPNEVLIIRRGGKIWKSDENTEQGGARFIYPLLGEEVRARVSLAVKSLTWRDTVNIQEAIPCNIEVVVWWFVDDVSQYFFRNDLEKHPGESEEAAARNAAEANLRKLTGARVRNVASKADFQISLIEMLILKQSEYRAVHRASNVAEDAPTGIANISANLTRALQAELNPDGLNKEAQSYGLRVERVEVQSIDWATEIQRPILDMLLDRLKPERAKSQAEAARIIADTESEADAKRLRELSNVLGVPVTQMRELLQHLPSGSSNTQEELAKAIISEFKKLNPKPAPPGSEAEADRLESLENKSDGQKADGFELPKDKPER
jgi:regulator of protease activity HflC (stomatin/prohibitin superfamily)